MGYIAGRTKIVSEASHVGLEIDMQMVLKVIKAMALIAHLAIEIEKGLPLYDRALFRADLLELMNEYRKEANSNG